MKGDWDKIRTEIYLSEFIAPNNRIKKGVSWQKQLTTHFGTFKFFLWVSIREIAGKNYKIKDINTAILIIVLQENLSENKKSDFWILEQSINLDSEKLILNLKKAFFSVLLFR